MQKMTKRDKQLFWVLGALERLAHLGYLQDPPYHLVSDKIDFFLELDSYCQLLFESDKEFSTLLGFVCKDAGVTDPEEVASITQLARDYKDNRDTLAKFAFENNFQ